MTSSENESILNFFFFGVRDSEVSDEDYDSDSDSDYDLDLDAYQPIRPVNNEHDVTFITAKLSRLDHHTLQCMHHGSTVIHWEPDSGRSQLCCFKLEGNNGVLTWHKPMWSALKGGSVPDYVLKGDFESGPSKGLCERYCTGELVDDGLEEGYIDLSVIKDVTLGDESCDLSSVSRRHAIDVSNGKNCICLHYGTNIAENKVLYFVAPSLMATVWARGLRKLVKAAQKLKLQTDRRIHWLKVQYLKLYFEYDKCQGPTPAEAIKVS